MLAFASDAIRFRYLKQRRPGDCRPFEDDFEWMKSASFSEGHRQHVEQGRVSPESEVWTFEVLRAEDGG